MAQCPFAIQRPVTAHGGAIGSILGVVLHVTAGEGDPYNEFVTPANQVSSHFGVGNGQGGMADGAIEQYVDTSQQSWAQAAGNASYLSIETEGQPTEPLTAAQVAAVGRLMAWANQTHGVPLVVVDTVGQRGLITHGDGGAAWGGHTDCPGPLRSAQRAAILAAAGAAPPSPPSTVTVSIPIPIEELLTVPFSDPSAIVRWAYLEYLQREPDSAGFATDVNALAAGSLTVNQLIANLVDSPEGQAVLAAKRKSLGI